MGAQSDWLRDARRAQRRETVKDTVLTGVVDSVIYAKADGFAIVRLEAEGHDEPVVAKGDLGRVSEGQPLKLTGRFVVDPTYGRQFAATAAIPSLPRGAAGIVRWLASGAVPGVGEKTARRIVDALGADALDRIADDPGVLRPIVGKSKAPAIRKRVLELRVEGEVHGVLYAHGIGRALVRRIHQKYAEKAMEVVTKQPYKLAVDIEGVGFKRADDIARAAGIGEDDPARAEAAVMHVLRDAADEGHVLLPVSEITRRLEALHVPTTKVEQAIAALADRVARREGDVYLRTLFEAEGALARRLAVLARERNAKADDVARADRASKDLADAQREAVRATLRSGLVVLTGGPGTGKTTTLRAIVSLHEGLRRRIALAAPTGRAAKRMAEASGREAKTIHRLLEWNAREGFFARGASEPLEADLVVVDEASMLDLVLAQHLFAAVPDDATVLLVGDVDQLPPVGPGLVLRDVIDAGIARTVRLTEVFRQARKSGVVQNAHRVHKGLVPEGGPKDGDFHVVLQKDAQRAAEIVEKLVVERIPEAFGIPAGDVMVLAPMHKGPIGVAELNLRLQKRLNAQSHEGVLSIGDRVMQLKNDYERDVFNGDLGFVRARTKDTVTVAFDGGPVTFEGESIQNLTLAYASTIHKAQGSEFPAVVVVLGTGHHVMLARNLLYTAITRARRLAVIVAHPAALRRAVENARAAERFGRLRERIAAAAGVR